MSSGARNVSRSGSSRELDPRSSRQGEDDQDVQLEGGRKSDSRSGGRSGSKNAGGAVTDAFWAEDNKGGGGMAQLSLGGGRLGGGGAPAGLSLQKVPPVGSPRSGAGSKQQRHRDSARKGTENLLEDSSGDDRYGGRGGSAQGAARNQIGTGGRQSPRGGGLADRRGGSPSLSLGRRDDKGYGNDRRDQDSNRAREDSRGRRGDKDPYYDDRGRDRKQDSPRDKYGDRSRDRKDDYYNGQDRRDRDGRGYDKGYDRDGDRYGDRYGKGDRRDGRDSDRGGRDKYDKHDKYDKYDRDGRRRDEDPYERDKRTKSRHDYYADNYDDPNHGAKYGERGYVNRDREKDDYGKGGLGAKRRQYSDDDLNDRDDRDEDYRGAKLAPKVSITDVDRRYDDDRDRGRDSRDRGRDYDYKRDRDDRGYKDDYYSKDYNKDPYYQKDAYGDKWNKGGQYDYRGDDRYGSKSAVNKNDAYYGGSNQYNRDYPNRDYGANQGGHAYGGQNQGGYNQGYGYNQGAGQYPQDNYKPAGFNDQPYAPQGNLLNKAPLDDRAYQGASRGEGTVYGQGQADYKAQPPPADAAKKAPAPDPLTEKVDTNPLSSVATTGQARQYTQKKRAQKFEQLFTEFRKNEQDHHIKGFRPKDKTTSYILELRSVSELVAGALLAKSGSSSYDKLKVQLHCTFFYRNDEGKSTKEAERAIFFGRTARSQIYELKESGQAQGGKAYAAKMGDHMFFHSGLDKSTLAPGTFLVIECVIITERKYRKADEVKYLSGGYCIHPLFELAKGERSTQVQLQSGSPRDLATARGGAKLRDPGGKISVQLMPYQKCDPIRQLVPQNCLVGQNDMVPGLLNVTIPVPKQDIKRQEAREKEDQRAGGKDRRDTKDAKKKDYQSDFKMVDRPVEIQKRTALYLHNIEVQGSPQIEHLIENLMANMYCQKTADARGRMKDPREVNVQIQERRLNVKMHNCWKTIDQPYSAALKEPNVFGIFFSDYSLPVKDYLPHQFVGLIFELEFVAQLHGAEAIKMCLGYSLHMPELNSYGAPQDQDIELKFIKGPGENYDRDLLISEEASPNDEDISRFDFALRAYISSSPNAPDPNALNRTTKRLAVDGQAAGQAGAGGFQAGAQAYGGAAGAGYGANQPYGSPPPRTPPQLEFDAAGRVRPPDYGRTQYDGRGLPMAPPQLDAWGRPYNPNMDPKHGPPPGTPGLLQTQIYDHRLAGDPHYAAQEGLRAMRDEQVDVLRDIQRHQARGPGAAQQDGMFKLMELQRTAMNNEATAIRGYLDQFLGDLLKYQHGDRMGHNVHGAGFGPERSPLGPPGRPGAAVERDREGRPLGPDGRLLRDEQGRPYPPGHVPPAYRAAEAHTGVQMQQIANVFYNLLNMLGAKNNDERLIGISRELRDMIQTKKFENLLEAGVPAAPRDRDYPAPKPLSAADQSKLLKHNMGELLEHPTAQIPSSAISKDQLSVDAAARDPLTASQIQIKFLCYKTPTGGLKKVPRKMQFQFRFFTFPDIETDFLRLDYGDHQTKDGRPLLKPGTAYFLQRSSNRSISNTEQMSRNANDNIKEVFFEVDPSVSKIEDQHMRLAQYLKTRSLTIDIFDAHTRFFYGACKIPLYELMRQPGQSQVVRALECEIFHPDSRQYQGHLQVIMSNVGKAPSVAEDWIKVSREGIERKPRRQPAQGAHHKNNKVVVSKPMDFSEIAQAHGVLEAERAKVREEQRREGLDPKDREQFEKQEALKSKTYKSEDYSKVLLNQLSAEELSASMQNPDLRKKLRVDRVRKLTQGDPMYRAERANGQAGGNPFQQEPDWMKHKKLQQIEAIRQTKKEMVLHEVMGTYLADAQIVPLVPGEITFQTFPLENTTPARQAFVVVIRDPDAMQFQREEVELVYAPHELEHWVDRGRATAAVGKNTTGDSTQPRSYDVIQNTDTVTLEPGEKVDLLFKFLTHREVSHSATDKSTVEVITQRSVKIEFLRSNEPYRTIECQLLPINPPLDHVYRAYEAEHSYFKLQIPPLMHIDREKSVPVRIQTSRPTAHVKYDKESAQLVVQGRTGAALTDCNVIVYVYDDEFMGQLLSTFKVVITPLQCLYSQTKAGIQNSMTLALPVKEAKVVEIHTNHPKNVYLPKKSIHNEFRLIPNAINHIQLHTKTFAPEERKAVVNAVDQRTGQLVYSWLLLLSSLPPTPTEQHDLQARLNTLTRGKISFTNSVKKDLTYEIATSRSDLMEPREPIMQFRSGETQTIELDIFPQTQMGVGEVFLYITDTEWHVQECYAIQILYSK